MRLWVEISIHQFIAYAISRQPPCEAVSWNVLSDCVLLLLLSSASLWGCELKCVCVSSSECFFQSASLWGCELKCTVRSGAENCLIVSLLVRLWVEIYCDKETGSVALVSLLVRLWVEMWIICYWLMRTTCQPPCEAVSWNTSQATQSSLVLLSASLWGCELKYNCHPSIWSLHESASLWGCELKYHIGLDGTITSLSASLWGCELK